MTESNTTAMVIKDYKWNTKLYIKNIPHYHPSWDNHDHTR